MLHCANRWIVVGVVALIARTAFCATAKPPLVTSLTVVKKPGKADGDAMATVHGKAGRVARHAVQAWTIMDGAGALLLLSPEKRGQPYRLRYYELDVSKGRPLGYVPFAKATLTESKEVENRWAFALTGIDPATKQPVTFAGDVQAIHARIDGASEPRFSAGSLSFHTSSGRITRSLADLMGWDIAGGIYAPPANSTAHAAYLEFLPDGRSLTTDAGGRIERGRWITNGPLFRITSPQGAVTVWRRAALSPVSGIPAGSRLSVRLLQPLSSRTAKAGMEVRTVSITPGISEGSILIPQGSEFDGKIVAAHGVGWGIKHETAALTVHFDKAKLPDGRILPIDARVFQVENAREDVTDHGKIQGIRSTGTLGYSAENGIDSLAQVDPIAYLFLAISGSDVLGFADPEIRYDAGTDVLIEFQMPVITAQEYAPRVPRIELSGAEEARFQTMIKALPFRTTTEIGGKASDLTNLIFIGNPDSLRRAFAAAGWAPADQLTSASTFQTMKTLGGNQTYTQAPMSTLLLDNQKPLFTLQKSTNTFSSRHHLRVFPTNETFDGRTVLTASSTQDIGIAFSYREKTFIHVIDQFIDNERSKVTNDLDFTGCVDDVDLVSRPWVPQDAYNSTGDRLRTDGDATVLFLNDCSKPRTTPDIPALRAGLLQRSERNTALAVKNTFYRGNLVYQGISGGIKVDRYLTRQGELGEATGHWRKSDASGAGYKVFSTPDYRRRVKLGETEASTDEGESELNAAARARVASHRWDPPHYAIAIQGGYSRYVNNFLEFAFVALQSNAGEPTYLIGLADAVYDGWAAGISLTANTWNYVSSEFAYTRQQTKFDLLSFQISSDPNVEPGIDAKTVGLTTRQAEYNLLLHALPRKSRFRPYIAAGPVLQLISLSSAPLKQPSGYFRLGLSNIGLIKAAFDFGNTPPLNGGGIFQVGLQYGGGIEYRVLPHLMLRSDVRGTWSKNPAIVKNSYKGYLPVGLDNTYSTDVSYQGAPASYRQQRLTVGFAFTF